MTTFSTVLRAKTHLLNRLADQPRSGIQIFGILFPSRRQSHHDPIEITRLVELPGIDCPAHRDLQALARMSEAGIELGTAIDPEVAAPPNSLSEPVPSRSHSHPELEAC